MRKLHIRLEYEEAVEGKRELLESQINLLEILKRVKNYKILRKRELILKGKLKKSLSFLSSELNQIKNNLPESENELGIKEETTKQEIEKDKNIESQLQEIREKLARLQ